MGGKLPKGMEKHGNFKSIEPKDTPTFVSKKKKRQTYAFENHLKAEIFNLWNCLRAWKVPCNPAPHLTNQGMGH